MFDGIAVTCIDNGMPVVLMRAEALGCSGYESPQQLEADSALRGRLESIRRQAGLAMNLGDVSQRNVPKMCLVSAAASGGTLNTRTFIPHRCHTSIGVFGAVSVATACTLPGTVASQIAGVALQDRMRLSIEHPTGEFTVEANLQKGELLGCGLVRTSGFCLTGSCVLRGRFGKDGSRSHR